MKHHTYSLQLLSPCFNGGARPKDFAELRVPSLRGQIRWWYREATPRGDEKGIFGGVGRDTGSKRSSVTFRIPNPAHSTESMALLPHKNRGGGERPALPPQAFDLHCRCREETFTEVDRAVRLWVLLGGLGCRCNRAAGSVWYAQDAPGSPEAFAKDLRALTPHSNWDVRLAPVESLASGRVIASDTVDGHPEILGGIRPRRKESPIKFKLVELGGRPHLLMFAPKPGLWERALDALAEPRGGGGAKPLCSLDWSPVN